MRRFIWPALVVVLLAFIHLFFFAQSVSLKYELTDLKMKFMEIYQKNRYTQSVLAGRESLELLDGSAQKLGMVYPEDINYIVLSREAE
ncbi:hypothetical protein HZC35_05885 [Candidatus Saganbacteria bacterium]|nr:hypothetical protein [Candidatus Saganbacteria bacterium]